MSHDNEILETLKAARSYLNLLNNLSHKIRSAEEQILESSQETESTIETTFRNLLTNVTQILLSRKTRLIQSVENTKIHSLSPLKECKSDISKRIENTKKLISEGESLLQNCNINVAEFNEKSSSLGSLPEIPDLTEVPFISFQYEPHLEFEILNLCSEFGEVSKIAPIQISQMVEKPGAILVEWQSVECDERCVDIQEFRLQRAFGDVLTNSHLIANFLNCYLGVETQFLVKDLQANQPYSFRVCCKFEGSNEWSPWSLPQVFSTTIKSFSWMTNGDFSLSNENRIAKPLKKGPSLLTSDGPQFSVGYSVEFTYLEFDHKLSTIGLIATNDDIKVKFEDNCYFALNSMGEIYVDGVKKCTQLPEVTKGSRICFVCESLHDGVRVSIETCDKQVTYDWHINEKQNLFFAAQLSTPGCKIMVE